MKKALIILSVVNLMLVSFFVLSLEGYSLNKSTGSSMCPSLATYSLTINKKIYNTNEVKLGEIYNYRIEGLNGTIERIQHRCVGMDEDYFIFRGDNNYDSEVILKELVYKKLIFSFPIIKCEEKDLRV